MERIQNFEEFNERLVSTPTMVKPVLTVDEYEHLIHLLKIDQQRKPFNARSRKKLISIRDAYLEN